MTDVIYSRLYGIDVITKEEINPSAYDIVILALKDIAAVSRFLLEIGFKEYQLIKAEVFINIDLDLKKYMLLKESKISIISKNCAGGFLYHRYGLEFNSPTINTFFDDENFFRYLSDIEKYNNFDIHMFGNDKNLNGSEWGEIYGVIDDVKVLFPHAVSKAAAYDEWNRRKKRVNYDNIFILTYAESDESIEMFSSVRYPGICITNIFSNIKNTYTPVDFPSSSRFNIPFSMLNRLTTGALKGIDWISSMLEKRIVTDSCILYK